MTWERLTDTVVPILLGVKVSKTSLKRHLRHCQVVDGEACAYDGEAVGPDAETAELLEEIGALLEGSRVSATGLLNLQLRTHLLDLRRRLRNGERLPVTTDQAARAADRLIQAERKEGELELLGVLGAAVGAWGQAALERSEPVLEIEAAEVIEGSS